MNDDQNFNPAGNGTDNNTQVPDSPVSPPPAEGQEPPLSPSSEAGLPPMVENTAEPVLDTPATPEVPAAPEMPAETMETPAASEPVTPSADMAAPAVTATPAAPQTAPLNPGEPMPNDPLQPTNPSEPPVKKSNLMPILAVFISLLLLAALAYMAFVSPGFLAQDTAAPSDSDADLIAPNEEAREMMYELTAEEIARHNLPDDCWVIVLGKVYNVSGLYATHTGGDTTITDYCGQDGTVAFQTKAREEARDHSENAYTAMEAYLIGNLGDSVPASALTPSQKTEDEAGGTYLYDPETGENTAPDTPVSDEDQATM
jgi:cytochrome b involved in lipid metabolism